MRRVRRGSLSSELLMFVVFLFFKEEDLFCLQINKKNLQKKRKTDISNTVRKIVEKQKQKVRQP